VRNRGSLPRSRRGLSVPLIAAALGITVFIVSVSVCADIFKFPDPRLEAAVRQQIETHLHPCQKPPGWEILESDLAGVTSLGIFGTGVLDLTGIEYCVNLVYLNLEGTQIEDLTPLSGLTNLEELHLDVTQIENLSPLSGLTNLEELRLEQNQLTPLSGLTNLTWLSLSITQIEDLTPLSGLTNLTWLNLTLTEIEDLTPLAGLINLELLYLELNQIDDLTPLSGLANLRLLGLEVNRIEDLAPLSGLTNLEVLYLGQNQIEDLTPLASLTSLTNLSLSDNQIKDLTPLSGLTSLTNLCLSDNQIKDLTLLSGLTNLTWLSLSINQIKDLTPLASLTSLTFLGLVDNQIQDLTPLVANSVAGGLGEGDRVNVQHNYLDLSPGSTDMAHIQALIDRGVEIEYEPQYSLDDEKVIAVQPAVNQPPSTTIETAEIDQSEGRASFTWSGNDDTTETEDLVYEYRLLNPDLPLYDWSGWSSQRAKTYTNLPAGSYRFEVHAKDEDGAIDSSPASKEFPIVGVTLNCVIHLRPQDVEASIGDIGDFTSFDIYVGASVGDVSQVRFSSDESLDGTPSGKWTEWYDWNSNARFSPWDAVAKTMDWSFATGGNKEVWAEIKNRDGNIDRVCAPILVQIPEWRRDLRIGDILYDPCGAIFNLGHVGIYIGKGKTVDPQKNECIHSISTWDTRDYTYILRVFDLSSASWAEEEARAAATWTEDLVNRMGKSYSYQYPILSLQQEKNPDEEETEWYCSELVWAAYFNQGIDIEVFPGHLEPGHLYNQFLPVSPNEICEDDNVYPVGGQKNGSPMVVLKRDCDCPERIAFILKCPVDLIVTDPDGLSIGKGFSEIPGGIYWVDDVDGDDSVDVLVELTRKEGVYQVQVEPRPEAKPTDTYTLLFEDHRTSEEVIIANETPVKDIPDEPYQFELPCSETSVDIDEDSDGLFDMTSHPGSQVRSEHVRYTIAASAATHGTINPEGYVAVTRGEDKTFAITPDEGHVIHDVLVDGNSVLNQVTMEDGVGSYTFVEVPGDHTIHATFAREAIPEKREQPIWWWLAAGVVLSLSGVVLIRLRRGHR